MWAKDESCGSLFSYVDLEARVRCLGVIRCGRFTI